MFCLWAGKGEGEISDGLQGNKLRDMACTCLGMLSVCRTRPLEGNYKHRSLLRRLSVPSAMITHVGHARGASRSTSASKPLGVLEASTWSQLLGSTAPPKRRQWLTFQKGNFKGWCSTTNVYCHDG